MNQHHHHRRQYYYRADRPAWWDIPPQRSKRYFFWRLVAPFGGMIFLFVIALAIALGIFISSWTRGQPQIATLLVVGCLVPLLFALSLGIMGRMFYQRFASPIVNVMEAADRVAGGDLSARVDEHYRGEFGRLARSFNRMTAELERSDQQRKSLTADIAHELRTPLHIIQGNLEGVLDGVYQATPEHITATLEETRLLARLVSDLQTLSLAESGQLPLYPVQIQAADLLEDVVTSFTGQAAASGVELGVTPELAADAGLAVWGDPDRLDQVFCNLVGNALRYTPAGGKITLGAGPIEGGVRFTVQDSGQGIAPEDLPNVFDRFWKGDRSRTRHAGTGSGLGLAIARQLVLAHHGEIRVESNLGQGTTFTIDLPAEEPPESEA